MKRLALLLAIATCTILTSACSKLFTPTSLAGTVWEYTEESRYHSGSSVISFSEDQYLVRVDYTDSNGKQSYTIEGEYTYIAPNLILKHKTGDMPGTVSGMTLTITVNGIDGTYVRQK